MAEFEDKYEQWRLETYNEKLYYGLTEDDARSFRFATKEEILEFKNRQKKFKQIKKEIEVKQEEISKLYKEL